MIALIVVAVLVLAGGGVAAAVLLTGDDDGGGDADDAPKSASVEEFCEGLNEFDEVDDEASPEEQVEQAHEVADRLSEIGTPEDIPDDAREGFEIYLEAISEVDADDIEALENVESEEELADALGISSDDQEKITAFFEYTFEACSELSTPEIPSDIPRTSRRHPRRICRRTCRRTSPPGSRRIHLPTDFGLPTDFSFPTGFRSRRSSYTTAAVAGLAHQGARPPPSRAARRRG